MLSLTMAAADEIYPRELHRAVGDNKRAEVKNRNSSLHFFFSKNVHFCVCVK